MERTLAWDRNHLLPEGNRLFPMLRFSFTLFLLLAGSLRAQTSSGTLSGAVLDSSGAVVSGAQIRIIGAETGDVVRGLTSNELGLFVAPLLRPGAYTIEVTFAGFKKLTRQGVLLRVDEVLDLRLTLEPGGIN